eukprot:COSAG02_NODE_2617_length_8409_cov_2.491697_7_plen_85_part_00
MGLSVYYGIGIWHLVVAIRIHMNGRARPAGAREGPRTGHGDGCSDDALMTALYLPPVVLALQERCNVAATHRALCLGGSCEFLV